jgi:hypothetical protein
LRTMAVTQVRCRVKPGKHYLEVCSNNSTLSESSEEPCMHCGHPYSAHFSDDVRGLGSKDFSKVHQGCAYNAESAVCQCPGFKALTSQA